ncbi:MAG TPA: endonuclease/exonuclease/phosphatase family protein, partial [Chitinispirillaceae bacterium]|nr:endonuclease/exonuclease/phosphatase family protein [Chitinispirillaceae bacterium]
MIRRFGTWCIIADSRSYSGRFKQTESPGFNIRSSRLIIVLINLILCQFISSCKSSPADHSQINAGSASTIAFQEKPCKSGSFVVAFYNTENCFDFQYDGNEYPEYVPGSSSWTKEIQLVKINSMAEVISSLKADVMGLCEVEDEDALDDLKKGLIRYGVTYKYFASGCGQTRSSTCPMLLSRFPVQDVVLHHVDLPGKSITREILEADVVICGHILKVFVSHWPSKLHPESYRLKTAEVLSERLKQLPAGCEYILLGDFNSDYNEYQTFSSFKLNNTEGKTGINTVLRNVITTGNNVQYITEENIKQYSSGYLFDLWLELPENDRMSMVYRGNNQTPDHIMIPWALCDSSGISYVDNSFGPFTWNGKLLRDGKPYRWQIKWVKKQKIHLGKGYSDHLPVKATFKIGPFTRDTTKKSITAVVIDKDTMKSHRKMSVTHGFETSSDGWIASAGSVKVKRDPAVYRNGHFSLKITTPALKTNGTVARVVFNGTEKGKGLKGLYCKGNGKFSFRV